MAVIEVSHLKKYFGAVKAVDNITFSVEKGEVFGFLGPNGAGKTTTIRCLMDFIRPTDGSITILDTDANNPSENVALKQSIGFLSGSVKLYPKWTGQMHIQFVRSFNGVHDDMSDELVQRFDFDPTKKTKALSSGNRQKLGIIMAFMHRPQILIMDEPTNALDPLLQNEVYRLIDEAKEWGATVFMSSHNLAEVDRVCSRVGIIKEGKMVATESILSLKEKRLYTVTAYFHDHVDPGIFSNDSSNVVKELEQGMVIQTKGDINPLIDKLQQHKLRDITIAHASLEDIFLEFYE